MTPKEVTTQCEQQRRIKSQGRCVDCWKPRGHGKSVSRCQACLALRRERYRADKAKRSENAA